MMKAFYTVVILKLDFFESTIIDERHFGSHSDATEYAMKMNEAGYVPVIAEL